MILYVHAPVASCDSFIICAGLFCAAFPKSTHTYGVVDVMDKMSYCPEMRKCILVPPGPASGCEPCAENPDGASPKLYDMRLLDATAALLAA